MIKSKNNKMAETQRPLNSKVDVYAKIKTKNDMKETVFDFDVVDSIWVQIVPQTGKLQTQQADTILANVTHKIYARFNACKYLNNGIENKEMTKDMYIMYRGKRFNIKYILNPYFEDEWLEIFAEEVIE